MIREGLLWHIEGSDLAHEVAQAAQRYHERCGVAPEVCYLHPTTLPGVELLSGLVVQVSERVAPRHVWVGREEKHEHPDC